MFFSSAFVLCQYLILGDLFLIIQKQVDHFEFWKMCVCMYISISIYMFFPKEEKVPFCSTCFLIALKWQLLIKYCDCSRANGRIYFILPSFNLGSIISEYCIATLKILHEDYFSSICIYAILSIGCSWISDDWCDLNDWKSEKVTLLLISIFYFLVLKFM